MILGMPSRAGRVWQGSSDSRALPALHWEGEAPSLSSAARQAGGTTMSSTGVKKVKKVTKTSKKGASGEAETTIETTTTTTTSEITNNEIDMNGR